MDDKIAKRLVLPSMKALNERLEKAGIDATVDRWSAGIDHHPKSEQLVCELADLDYVYFNDHFDWKTGGDGDNGEALMYMLDVLFDLYDKEAANAKTNVG